MGSFDAPDWICHGNDSYLVTGCRDKSVRLWNVTRDRDRSIVCLLWSSGHGRLAVSEANISSAQGLSGMNVQLLEERGASSGRVFFSECTLEDE